MRAIASTFIHAVVLCESAQRYRALMVILQSHRTQNMILRCYPNVSAILRRHTKSCLLCFFNNPYISPFLIHRITCLCSFFYMLCSIRVEPELCSAHLVGLKCARRTRARARRAQACARAYVRTLWWVVVKPGTKK